MTIRTLFAILSLALGIALFPQVSFAEEKPENPSDLAAGIFAERYPGEKMAAQADSTEGKPAEAIPMHRLYNTYTGEHFYTGDSEEKDSLSAAGWFYEGVSWQAPARSNTPVFRLYNSNAADHFYTTNPAERLALIHAGWADEGIGWYSDDSKSIAVYRQYNPNAWSGTHNFTCDEAERDDLVRLGWADENVAWHACGEGWSGETTWFSGAHLQALADSISGSGDVTPGYRTSIDQGASDNLNRLMETDVPVTFLAVNARTGKSIARGADTSFYGASAIKAPYAASLCKYDAPGITGQTWNLQAMIRWSSNEAFDSLVASYGTFYESIFARESGIDALDYYLQGSAYAYLSPRELAKLWITTRQYIISTEPNVDLFRSLFTNGYFKEGWMSDAGLGGQTYHLAGIEGDVIYAIMTGYTYPDGRVWEVRDAILAAIG